MDELVNNYKENPFAKLSNNDKKKCPQLADELDDFVKELEVKWGCKASSKTPEETQETSNDTNQNPNESNK